MPVPYKKRSNRLSGRTPLAYLGSADVNASSQVFWIDRAPTTNDYDTFLMGALWIDTSPASPANPEVYMLVRKDSRIAKWVRLFTGASGFEKLTADTGTNPVIPDGADNINTLGGDNINTVATANTIKTYLNETIHWPNTNAAGTSGMIYLGGSGGAGGTRFLHNYGTNNTFLGEAAGNLALSGSYCVGIGSLALNAQTTAANCTAIGTGTLSNLLTGSDDIALGFAAGDSYVGAESSNIVIGNVGLAAENNTIRIGTHGSGAGEQDRTFIAGVRGVTPTTTDGFVVVSASDHQLGTLASSGSAGEVLTSNGAGSLPTFQLVSGILPWINSTGATQAMVINTGYIANRAAGIVTFSLPATADVGTVLAIAGSQNGWTLTQNAGQTVHFLGSSTTTGIGGSLTSTTRYDSIELICVVIDTDFVVKNAVGNITIV